MLVESDRLLSITYVIMRSERNVVKETNYPNPPGKPRKNVSSVLGHFDGKKWLPLT